MAGAMKLGNAMFAQSDEMGALPILYAATEPDLPDDRYLRRSRRVVRDAGPSQDAGGRVPPRGIPTSRAGCGRSPRN